MTVLMSLQTLFEIILVAAFFWCIFHEDRLIAFEKNIIAAIRRRRIRVVKSVPQRMTTGVDRI